jgi:hypothetical protein
MTPQDFTTFLVLDILCKHRRGLTGDELLREMLRRTEEEFCPLYLGPGLRLRDFLEDLSISGMVLLSSEAENLKITPTSKLLHSASAHRVDL